MYPNGILADGDCECGLAGSLEHPVLRVRQNLGGVLADLADYTRRERNYMTFGSRVLAAGFGGVALEEGGPSLSEGPLRQIAKTPFREGWRRRGRG